jgi:hypothetical protein
MDIIGLTKKLHPILYNNSIHKTMDYFIIKKHGGNVLMRLRRAQTTQEMERVVDDLITQGYKVKSRGERSVKMKHEEYGSLMAHIIIFILFGWWTLLIANVLYAAYKYVTGDEVLIQLEDYQVDNAKINKCVECGQTNNAGSQYCQSCGTSL